MARRKIPWGTMLAFAGLAWGSIALYRKVTAIPPVNPPILVGDQPLIKAESEKISSMAQYHRQVYGTDDYRNPTQVEMDSLSMMANSMNNEEGNWPFDNKPLYRETMMYAFQNILGISVILPIVAGYMVLGGMVVWDRYARPVRASTPVQCPKCAATLADPDVAMAHVENSHTVTADAGAIAAASQIWSNQPYWTVTTTGVMGGAYDQAHRPMEGWSFDALSQNVRGMAYSWAMGIGTAGTLQALSTTLVYCLV